MNPSQYWLNLINESQRSTPDYDSAWQHAMQTHSDACTLMKAFGASRANLQFFNERFVSKPHPASRGKAREEFTQKVHARMSAANCDYDTAFNWVGRHFVELANEASGNVQPQSVPGGSITPVFGPQLKALFFLPIGADQAECAAAWRGNGNCACPINPGKVFAGLVEHHQTIRNMSYESSITEAKNRYPQLWEMVTRISKAV